MEIVAEEGRGVQVFLIQRVRLTSSEGGTETRDLRQVVGGPVWYRQVFPLGALKSLLFGRVSFADPSRSPDWDAFYVFCPSRLTHNRLVLSMLTKKQTPPHRHTNCSGEFVPSWYSCVRAFLIQFCGIV